MNPTDPAAFCKALKEAVDLMLRDIRAQPLHQQAKWLIACELRKRTSGRKHVRGRVK